MENKMIYLDYSATTPVNKEVLETFNKVVKEYIGNPNSLHKLGGKSASLIEASTNQIANILKVKPSEIIYTSGASEANNFAIKGICLKYQNRGRHIITTKLEHSSVVETIKYLKDNYNFKVDYVNLIDGVVDINQLKTLIREDTILVSITSMNSETGLIQPVNEIGKLLKEYPKLYFHSDMTQSFGKEKLNLENIDLVSFSSQKFYGFKNIGGLIKKESIVIEPLIHGGKSTTKYRSGTPSVELITTTAKALRLVYDNFYEKQTKVKELNNYLKEKLKELDIVINSNHNCSDYIVNISILNHKPETIIHILEEDNIYISTKTACSSSEESTVVYELTKDKKRALSSLRISISFNTSKEELDKLILSLRKII